MASPVARVLRDPLLHFLLLGVFAFALYAAQNRNAAPDESVIVVSTAQQTQLAATFTRTRQRPPQGSELKGLIDDFVREEIANREATAMGLAQNDPVVRRRLRQKYESLMQQIIASGDPSESELERWHRENAERYRRDARYTLRQAFFSSERRENAELDARRVLESTDPDATEVAGADAIALPERFENAPGREIAARLGPAFSSALADTPTGRWAGPIASAYGQHLVFIEAREASTLPTLADVREQVLRDWRAEQLREARGQLYDELLERYTVRIEG